MVKKKTSRTTKSKHVTVSPTHFMIKRSLISYAVLVFVVFATVAMSLYLVERMATAQYQQSRANSITSIYDDLQLGDSYRIAYSNVFGDKRKYDADHTLTQSSRVEYGHNDTVSNTTAEVKKRVEAAGFKQIDKAYAGSVAEQLVFKNDSDEYLRVNVATKALHDRELYGVPTQEEWNALDKNAAPSYVTILVNLDTDSE